MPSPPAKLTNTREPYPTDHKDANDLNTSTKLLNTFTGELFDRFDRVREGSSIGAAIKESSQELRKYQAKDRYPNPYHDQLWHLVNNVTYTYSCKLQPELRSKTPALVAARQSEIEKEKGRRVLIECVMEKYTEAIGQVLGLRWTYTVEETPLNSVIQYCYAGVFVGDPLPALIARCALHLVIRLVLPTFMKNSLVPYGEIWGGAMKMYVESTPAWSPISGAPDFDERLARLSRLREASAKLTSPTEIAFGPFVIRQEGLPAAQLDDSTGLEDSKMKPDEHYRTPLSNKTGQQVTMIAPQARSARRKPKKKTQVRSDSPSPLPRPAQIDPPFSPSPSSSSAAPGPSASSSNQAERPASSSPTKRSSSPAPTLASNKKAKASPPQVNVVNSNSATIITPEPIIAGYNAQIENGEIREWIETGQGQEEFEAMDRTKIKERLTREGIDGPYYARLRNGEVEMISCQLSKDEATFVGEELLGDSYSLQCASFPESFFISDAVKLQFNKTANRAIWTIYSVSLKVAHAVLNSDFFKEFALRRMFNPDVSKIHFIIATDQVGNIVPAIVEGEQKLHDLVEAAIEDHNEAVRQRSDLNETQQNALVLPPHDRNNPFYTYTTIENGGTATTKEHWKRIIISHIRRPSIKVIETTSNFSIVGMGFWKWVYKRLKRVESTESMRTSEHARNTTLYNQVLDQYRHYFHYKQVDGLILPHTATSILPSETTKLQQKLNSQSLGLLSKKREQEKKKQAEARRDRIAQAPASSAPPPPPLSGVITLAESHFDLDFNHKPTQEEAEVERAILNRMGDFHAVAGDEGTILCTRCLTPVKREATKAMEKNGFSHSLMRCTAPAKLLPGCSGLWIPSRLLHSVEDYKDLLKTQQLTLKTDTYSITTCNWVIKWYSGLAEDLVGEEAILLSMTSHLRANPNVEPYAELLMTSKHRRGLLLSTTLSPAIYVSSKNSEMGVVGGMIRANHLDLLAYWMLHGRRSSVVKEAICALNSESPEEEVTAEQVTELDDGGDFSADENEE